MGFPYPGFTEHLFQPLPGHFVENKLNAKSEKTFGVIFLSLKGNFQCVSIFPVFA